MLDVDQNSEKRIRGLTSVSYAKYIDLEKTLDWSQGVNRNAIPKIERSSWVFGTPYWERLSTAQKHELLWQEIAREVSLFIMLEQIIPPMYVNYVNQHEECINAAVRDYLYVFSKEELVHIMMFRRYLESAGLQQFAVPEGYRDFYQKTLPGMPPIYGIFATLLIENIAEFGVMFSTQSEEIDPLTRSMFSTHHKEELRHLSFGKLLVECHIRSSSHDERARLLGFGTSVLQRSLPQYVFNKEILDRLGFDLGPHTGEEIEAVRQSDNNRAINRERFGPFFDWLAEIGIDVSPIVAL